MIEAARSGYLVGRI